MFITLKIYLQLHVKMWLKNVIVPAPISWSFLMRKLLAESLSKTPKLVKHLFSAYHSSHFTIARLKSTLCQGCSQHPFWLGGWTLIVGLQQDRLHPKGPDLHQLLQPSEKNCAEKTGRDHLQVEELQCGSFQTNLKSIALGNPGKCLCRQILLMETSTFPDRLHGGEEIRTFQVFAWLVSSECDRTEKRDSLQDSCSRQHSWSHCCLFSIFFVYPTC